MLRKTPSPVHPNARTLTSARTNKAFGASNLNTKPSTEKTLDPKALEANSSLFRRFRYGLQQEMIRTSGGLGPRASGIWVRCGEFRSGFRV